MFNELSKPQLYLQQLTAVMMLAGAALYMWQPLLATILYCAGALVFCPLQMLQRYDGKSFTLRRLRRQQLLGLVAFLCAACFMVMQTFRFGFARRNEWVVALTIGCVLELYTAFRIPAEMEKEKLKG